MPAKFAMIAVVGASETTARGFAKFRGSEEGKSFFLRAAKPTCGFRIHCFERPREILDFDKLPNQSGTGIMASI